MNRRQFLAASTLSVAGLSGCLGDTEYRVTDATTTDSMDSLAISATVATPGATIEYPAVLALTLENTAEDPVQVRSYGVWPFGVLALAPVPDPDEDTWKTTLFSPAYDESDHVEVSRRGASMSVDLAPIERMLDAGEATSTRYTLRGDDVTRTGPQFLVPKYDDYDSQYATDGDWTAFDYEGTVTVTEQSRLPF